MYTLVTLYSGNAWTSGASDSQRGTGDGHFFTSRDAILAWRWMWTGSNDLEQVS